MTHLHDRHDIASGDPQEIREEARGLRTVSENIDVLVRLLRCVSTHGVWESEAGRTFAEQVGETPDDLDDVCARLHDTARVLDPCADLLEDAQRRLRDLDDDYGDAMRTRDARQAELDAMSAEDPDRARVARERADASARAATAASDFERESDEAIADEKRAAAKLTEVCLELADPKGYDAWEGLTDAGADAKASPLAWPGGPVSWAGAAEPVGLAGRRVFYDEGSWAEVAGASAVVAAGAVHHGAGKVIGKARKTFDAGPPPPTPTRSTGRFPTTPGRAMGNPIARHRLRDIGAARTRVGRAAQTAKHDAADVISAAMREKTGIADIEQFAGDWQAVAGSGAGKVVIVGAHGARHGARTTQNVGYARRRLDQAGVIDDPATEQTRTDPQRHGRTSGVQP